MLAIKGFRAPECSKICLSIPLPRESTKLEQDPVLKLHTPKAKGLKRKGDNDAPEGSKSAKSAKAMDSSKSSSRPAPASNQNQDGEFKGYSLCDIPREAWPQDKPNKGMHGYTVTHPNGAATRRSF